MASLLVAGTEPHVTKLNEVQKTVLNQQQLSTGNFGLLQSANSADIKCAHGLGFRNLDLYSRTVYKARASLAHLIK